jgi:uncharacterized SAM-binding protein YcdF (DUF218 family)
MGMAARIIDRFNRRLRRAAMTAAVMAAAVYVLGFIVFAAQLDRHAPDSVEAADAIVALTGGEGRLAEAVKLLDDGKGARLLITGVHPEVKPASLKKALNTPSAKFDCCVDLGRQAEDTIGNATETAQWVRTHGYHSIILVTSTYHMPRAELELKRTMPDVAITPYPVVQGTLHLDGWWDFPGTTRLLVSEYTKYILTYVHARPLLRAS